MRGKLDAVTNPKHYQLGSIDVLDAIDDWRLDFVSGAVVKYVCRAGRKTGEPAVDAWSKAAFLCQRRVDQLTRQSRSAS